RITGMIGHSRLTASPRNASISSSHSEWLGRPGRPASASPQRAPRLPVCHISCLRRVLHARTRSNEAFATTMLAVPSWVPVLRSRPARVPEGCNRPRHLKPHCNSQSQTFEPVFASRTGERLGGDFRGRGVGDKVGARHRWKRPFVFPILCSGAMGRGAYSAGSE